MRLYLRVFVYNYFCTCGILVHGNDTIYRHTHKSYFAGFNQKSVEQLKQTRIFMSTRTASLSFHIIYIYTYKYILQNILQTLKENSA